MNWLSNFVLPKIRAVVAKKAVPDNLWTKCPGCEQMLFYRELEANLHVCRNCGHHLRIGAELRLKILFGDGGFTRIELPKTIVDPLKFRDRRRYADRLREGQAALGPGSDAVIVAHGEIGGVPAVVAAFEFRFMGGSMGIAARRGGPRRRQARRAAGGGIDRRSGLGRCPHAGRRVVADADAAHRSSPPTWSRKRGSPISCC